MKAKPGRFGGLRLELKLGDLRANRKNGDEVGRHGWCWGGTDLGEGEVTETLALVGDAAAP